MKKKRILILPLSLAVICVIIVVVLLNRDKFMGDKLSGTVGNLRQSGNAVTQYSRTGLGYGYNVLTSKYFNSGQINLNREILDINKLVKDKLVFSTMANEGGEESVLHVAGTSTKSYSKSLEAKVGIKASGFTFGGSFSNTFSCGEKDTFSSTDSFITTYVTKIVKRDYINISDEDMIRKYLNSKFKKDLNNKLVSADKLYQDYGTHIILNACLGGRININYTFHNTNQLTQKTLEDKAQFAYSYVKGSTDIKTKEEAEEFEKHSELAVNVEGGEGLTLTTLLDTRSAYGKWFDSLDANAKLNFVGVNFLTVNKTIDADKGVYDNINENSLFPIWKLANNEERRNELRKEYKTELDNSELFLNGLQADGYVKKIYFGTSKKSKGSAAENEATTNLVSQILAEDPDTPYVIVNHDLNYDAHNGKGKRYRIYMGYTLTSKPSEAITNLKLDFRDNKNKNDLPSKKISGECSYDKDDLDLTKGTGASNYINLYFTRDSKAGKPLKSIGVELGNNHFTFTDDKYPKGWSPVGVFDDHPYANSSEKTKLDINRKAGGKDIYLWQKR